MVSPVIPRLSIVAIRGERGNYNRGVVVGVGGLIVAIRGERGNYNGAERVTA